MNCSVTVDVLIFNVIFLLCLVHVTQPYSARKGYDSGICVYVWNTCNMQLLATRFYLLFDMCLTAITRICIRGDLHVRIYAMLNVVCRSKRTQCTERLLCRLRSCNITYW